MKSTSSYLTHLHIVGNRLFLGVIAACLLLTFALAPWYHTFDAALLIGLPAAVVPAWLVWIRPTALVTRCAIAASVMTFAALHIDQTHGMMEMHFSIFVMLAFLLFYRDWIPLVFAAAVIAVHHLAFDAMQRAGLPVFVFAGAGGLGIVLIHAAFVVFETAMLVWVSVQLRGEVEAVGCEPQKLSKLSQQLANGNLDVSIDTGGAAESSLAVAMERMRVDMKSTLDRERISSQENSQIRTALDRVAVGAMLVEPGGRVVYVNDFASAIFRTRAEQIRQQVPQFDPARVAGSLFSDLASASFGRDGEVTELRMGSAVFRTTANAVLDDRGTRLGTVVQWMDCTQEVGAEEDLKATVTKAIQGDLTARVTESGKEGFFKAFSANVNELVGNMADVVRAMSQAAFQVRASADEIARGNMHLSERTEQQATSLEETASSMEQMTSTVKNNAENAVQANQLATVAREQAERGGRVVNSAVDAMRQIEAASKKIADIIGVIDEIAFQTNLLALNAAVEAARAGDQGRGFAVVAAEVRNLASRSAEAAREIKALIHDSVNKVTEGTSLVNESGTVLVEIVNSVKRVTDVVAAIALSSREQASGIEQVNKSVTVMDSGTQQNAALVEQASAAARALTEQAGALTQLIDRYHVGGEKITAPLPPPVSAAAKHARVAPPKPDAAAKPKEQRRANRPWTGRSTVPASAAATARTPVDETDAAWKEF